MLKDFLNDFITIWVIIDPIAILPIFIGVTSGLEKAAQRRIAGTATLVSFIVLVFFVCLGQIIINAMGISMRSFEVAGGLILFIFAVQLVIGKDEPATAPDEKRETPMQMAIYPLAIPNLAGPGAMLTVILRTDNDRVSILEQAHTVAAVAAVLICTFGLLLLAGPITRLIGVGGANVIKRIMGMIVAAYAADLVLTGLAEWLHFAPI